MAAFGWGVDGYGRFHAHRKGSLIIIFCGLPGVSGWELSVMLQDQEESDDT